MFSRRGGICSGIVVAAILLLLQGPACPKEFPIADNPDQPTYYDSEISIGAAFGGTNYLVGIQESFRPRANCSGEVNPGNSRNIDAQLVSPTGALVGPRIKTGGNGGPPLVAFDGRNYLMVWEEDAQYSTHIYGRFVSTGGTLVGPQFTVGTGTDMNFGLNSILFDGANFFAVWQDRSTAGNDGTGVIFGQFITPSGELLGTRIQVSNAPHGQKEPTLAFDGTNILVAWVDGRYRNACYTDSHCAETDIFAQFVRKSSAASAGTLYGYNFLVSNSPWPRDNPITAAFDDTNYFIAFTQETTLPNACPASGCKWNAYGQIVTRGGARIGSQITISATAPNHFNANVIWLGSQYLVTWTEDFEGFAATIKGRYFGQSGAPLGDEFTLFSKSSNGTVPELAIPLRADVSNYFTVVTRGSPGKSVECSADVGVYGAFINAAAYETGSLKVTITPEGAVAAGAKWSYDGGRTWHASGTISLPVGSYTVTFKKIPGWTAPASKKVTIQNGKTTTVEGVYVK